MPIVFSFNEIVVMRVHKNSTRESAKLQKGAKWREERELGET